MYLRRFRFRPRYVSIAAITIVAAIVGIAFLPLRAIAGLESPCNYISDLIATNPLSSDLASTSDDHHRCVKLALKTTFPNINNAVTATDENLNALAASLTAAGILELEAAAPRLIIDETDGAANERIYDWAPSAGQLLGRTRTDADGAGATWLTVDRTGTTVDSIALASTALTWNTNTLFSTANDGSGSGLDADLLDGASSAAFAQLSAANIFTNSYASSATGAITVSATIPFIRWTETDGAANNQRWGLYAQGEAFVGETFSDNEASGGQWLLVNRTGTTVDSIALQASVLTSTGPVRGVNGTASAPTYSFSGETNTGIYRESSVISFASAGTRVAQLDGNAFEVTGTGIALDSDGTRVLILTGSGSPEGVQIANVGSLYLRNDSSTTLYVKQSGSGNTGWVAK